LTRIDDKKNHHNVSSSIPYPWKGTVPQAYVSFKGPGFSDNVSDGASNNTYVADWPAGWIGQFHLPGTKAILDYRNAYCSVMNTTPIVRFSASTGSFINGNGVNGDQPITVQYYCNNIKKSDSGVASGLMSMAFIANPGNLYGSTINGGGAKQYLISNGYGTTEIAKGVGVVLHYTDSSKNIRFSTSEFNLGLGAANGWYPVHENSVNISGNTWNKTINAKMIKLPDATEVTAGRYEASAKIVIKMQ
ncbi:fimbrial protein, partial [Aeromonas jandaei]